MPQRITFQGAARTVTGSKHVIEYEGKQILVDCGLFQGPRELRELNWEPLQFDPASLDAVILTHAHTDHIGYLPRLIKLGFRGPVYATPGTIGLCRISLPDGGRLQMEEARYHNRHGTSRHRPAEPLYTEADAFEALKPMRPVHYFQWQDLPRGATFRFIPAGHILGSAFAEVYFPDGQRILMSGDLGRNDRPIIHDPSPVEFAEFLVMESTYGDRLHSKDDPKAILKAVIQRAQAERGVVVVPSFAIGRTQELLWHLHELIERREISRIPIYVDSPMASATTLLYLKEDEDHDKQMKIDLSEGRSPFSNDLVTFVRDRQTSKELNDSHGPFVVISGSGMVSGGRVVHHLKRRLGDPTTTVLFTGYQAEGTNGRRMIDGADSVEILGEAVPIRAKIERIDSMSAHADADEIMAWLGHFKEPPKQTFLVHGELPVQEALKARIERELGWNVGIPNLHETFSLE
ncbi:MAG: MBL fold metallo-hydrolase [Fimbriimonadaceae bacterium]|nr:MBL fold metallo-hydrolase [Fimbriimonadaceae bacterium]QYK54674.1 MAG: MBL fold metallo-hydrolase [Fimbriimonadaceae bacterium]